MGIMNFLFGDPKRRMKSVEERFAEMDDALEQVRKMG